MYTYSFIDGDGSFRLKNPENVSYLYFPLASETGLKSAVTPNLGGDSKLDQESFLMEPVSSENLHNNRAVRNFWCTAGRDKIFSAVGASAIQEAMRFTEKQDESELRAGFMWHSLERTSADCQLRTTATSFIPRNENAEILYVTVENLSDEPQTVTGYGALPIYGRSADNIRDHRNVTSMLHRIRVDEHGIQVCPTMSFDERGHRRNQRIYYVMAVDGCGQAPEAFYPTVEEYLGEGGTYLRPRAVYEERTGVAAPCHAEGREAMGAMRFAAKELAPGERHSYILLLGVTDEKADPERILNRYRTMEKVLAALEETKKYWKNKVNIAFHSGDEKKDDLMKWICFQPYLRRLFGCSFLPHHDYGRGGRGWRDLWQDCLSLLLMEPGDVGRMIERNYGGVRIDGTNATIIGSGDGNFIADRNGIARVWMDHALWPLKTTKLYIDQTGDLDILLKKAPYFKDTQIMRGTDFDSRWNESYGSCQRTEDGSIYQGTVLEHMLLQQLAAYYEVGDHNIYRLRGADWNDALDMASEKGESVAFTCAYAGNLMELADLLRSLDGKYPGLRVELLEEMKVLLQGCRPDSGSEEGTVEEKQAVLESYASLCRHNISGRKISVPAGDLAENLRKKAETLMERLRRQEWIRIAEGEGWFNSYYDNHGEAVEGFHGDQVRMMLTGQVFAIMSGTATPDQIRSITAGADHYLYREEIGGYRLNTDFKELKFDMGRMFGFAYGEKENGAVFSHMTVMYANALYSRGFVKEGWKALRTLADHALDFETSCIYPGIPEYFRADGRGVYHYLTGAASWFMLTMMTEVYGVRGELGDLVLRPRLMGEQFDEAGYAKIAFPFAGRNFEVTYRNTAHKDYGDYRIAETFCEGHALEVRDASCAVLPLREIREMAGGTHVIRVELV